MRNSFCRLRIRRLMYTFDLLCFGISVVLYSAYNLYIRQRDSADNCLYVRQRDAAEHCYTIHGVSRIARIQWVASILEKKNGILAVQTLRNATMASTFMASTSILLAVGVLSLTGNGENVRHSWHSLNIFGSVEPGMLAIKILALLLNFFLAFFCFASSLRLYTHVGFMLGAETGHEDTDQLGVMAEKYLNMGADHFYLGMRAFYFTVPLVFWIFGAQFMVLGTVFLVSIVFFLDKTPTKRAPAQTEKQ